MLTYRMPVKCCGSNAVVVIREDGGLVIEGYEPEYELAFAAMGGDDMSICRQLAEEWPEDPLSAILYYVVDDLRVILSLAADALQQARGVFNEAFRAHGEQGDLGEGVIDEAIAEARRAVDFKTRRPPPEDFFWADYDLDGGLRRLSRIESGLFGLSSLDEQHRAQRLQGARRIIEHQALSNLFEAGAFLIRSCRKALQVEENEGSHLAIDDAASDLWQQAVVSAHSAAGSACWAIAFARCGSRVHEELTTRRAEAETWFVARFIQAMSHFEKTLIWRELGS
jgi:hypothetical protein